MMQADGGPSVVPAVKRRRSMGTDDVTEDMMEVMEVMEVMDGMDGMDGS